MVHYNQFHPSPRLRVEFNRWIRHRISVCTINRRLLIAGYLSHRTARCLRLTKGHRRRRREWPVTPWLGPLSLEALCLLWRVSLQTISQWWSESSSQAWRGDINWCLCATNRWQCGAIHHDIWRLSLQGRDSHCWEPIEPASLPTGVQAKSLALVKGYLSQ